MRRFGMGRVRTRIALAAIALAIAPVASFAQDARDAETTTTAPPIAVVTPTTAPTTAPAPALPPQLQAIREARDPSAAINAYAGAITWANGRPEDVVASEDALVHKMVEFGLPERAD